MAYASYKSAVNKKWNKGFIHFIIVILIIGQMFDALYYLVNHLFQIKHFFRLDLLFFVIKHGIFTLIIIYIYRHSHQTLGEYTRRKVLFLVFSFFTVISWFNGSICGFFYWDGPYRGTIVDADTKEPIAGANVMASWDFNLFLFILEDTIFADARETVTDLKGNFILPAGRSFVGWPFSRMHLIQLNVYKPGYDSHPPRMQWGWNKEDEKRWHDKLVRIYPKYSTKTDIKENYYKAFFVSSKYIKPNTSTIIMLNKAESYDEQLRATDTPYDRMDNSEKIRIRKFYDSLEAGANNLIKHKGVNDVP